MKLLIYKLLFLISVISFVSCSDDDQKKAGNPVMDVKTEFNSVMYGDSLPFTVNVSDEVPLSTLKARIYYGDEKVSEVVLRTKTNGSYSGKIYIPFLKNIPDGKAKLKFVLQNINFTMNELTYDLAVARPVYPYLTFITANKEYKMLYKSGHNYELTATLPQKIKGYIKTPKLTPNGNELTFGFEGGAIAFGSTEPITFSNLTAGEYTISFNTFDYSAAPFIIAYVVNGVRMEKMIESDTEDRYKLDLSLKKGDEVRVEGIDDFSEWWIDPDFFAKDGDKLTFRPIDGDYRIIADFVRKYLKVEVMSGTSAGSLKEDGSGAIWIVGDGVGKPALKYAPSWNPDMGICMAPMGNGKYQASFVAGETIGINSINFIFIHQKDWGTGFKGSNIVSDGNRTLEVVSDLIYIGEGKDVNGADNGNLALKKDKTLTEGKTYLFELEAPAGLVGCKLTITEE
ncbi:DUF5125 domain-containing protein [Bacteroidaceae bacterium HV4-6-C5C]|nr:DUF5125 domain-containing protein [Bacteroidaceae bacterium HV4-6-C5C]